GIKKLYKKMTGKKLSTQRDIREIMEIVSPTQASGMPFQIPRVTSSRPSQVETVNAKEVPYREEDSNEKSDSWKDRIDK
ncbi:MAG: hypothetical protein ACW972_12980, partial [Promethearchaeota archaeon]